jgi:fumarylpyruvate hydrolase
MSNPDFAIPAAAVPSLPIEGSEARFPVRRIYCIGRNYGAHVKEMGGDPKEQPPIFFMKPADAAVAASGAIPYPPGTSNFHHEIELVVALKAGGADVAADKALDLVYGYAVGVDLTRRDLQNTAKDKGQPWDSAKGFDASAPVGPIRPADKCGALNGRITIAVNGQTRQDGKLSDMIWGVAEIIAAVSKLWTLQAGDLIFTGTPDGVGPLKRGDTVDGAIDGLPPIAFTIA